MLPSCLVRTPSEEKEWRYKFKGKYWYYFNVSSKTPQLPRRSSWVTLHNNFFVLFSWWDSLFGIALLHQVMLFCVLLVWHTTKRHSGLSDDMPSELPWSPLSLQAVPACHLSVPVVPVISLALPLLFLHLCVVVCCYACFPALRPLLSWSLWGPLPSSWALLCYVPLTGWF